MLSRNAQGLYWIGRYLERAQHGCRLLIDQLETLKDRSVEEIELSWRRLYGALGRVPLGGQLGSNLGDDWFMLADAYTLADDLTFEPDNPDAVRSCLGTARENARQVRNTINKDLWTCLNLLFLGMRELSIEDIWQDRPAEFYQGTENAIRTFAGIADSTMYRDESWHFLQLGRFVERTQLLADLIDAQLATFPAGEQPPESDWLSLLRICGARVAYGRLFSLQVRPSLVVGFLVTDPLFSRSIRFSLGVISDALGVISAGQPLTLEAGRRAGRLVARIDCEWPNHDLEDEDATRALLQQVGQSSRLLHDDIRAAYFDYEIEDAPRS